MELMKPWYLSRTIWASIVTVMAAGGGLLGYPIDASQSALAVDHALQIVAGISGLAAIFGRFAATTRIG